MTPHSRWVLLILLLIVAPAQAQRLDLLLKGGRVIDPRNGIDAVQDVGIADGLIAQIAPSIPAGDAARVVDASGLIVTPGLIDLHAHLFFGTEEDAYLGNGFSALPPDGFTFRTGVTTAVDAGGAGWRTFRQFYEQTIAHSQTRVLAFINIVGAGMKGGPTEQNTGDMDAKLTAMEIARYPNEIVGVKLAHYEGPDWMPVDRAVEAGALAGVPVMIDFGRSEPPLPLEALFMEHLRPGDIFTHTYGKVDRREGLVEAGVLRPLALSARQRGIVFDVGHGGGSFLFSQAVPATRAGLWPATISTDLHTGSMNGGMKTLDNVMSKFLVLGMPLPEVITAATWRPAQVIHREDLGHLSVGAEADVAVFRVEEGAFGYIDSGGFRMDGDIRLVTEITVRAGEVVWDLNGRSRPTWNE